MTEQPDSSSTSAFAHEYGTMLDGQLLEIAAAYDSLVGPAQDALRAEFARRSLEAPLLEDAGSDEVISRRLITIKRYRDTSEAIVARSVLDSAGIFCFLRDENLVRLDWQISNFIGGVSLQVGPEDAEAAEQLLSQPTPESIEYGDQEQYLQPHCPSCGSIDIVFEGANRSAALISTVLVGIPLPLGGKSWRCNTCGCRWAEDKDESRQPDAV
jgi:hypothetical protein